MSHPYQNEDWLREKYHGEVLTVKEIAEMADCGTTTIYRYMNEYGIERRDVNETRRLKKEKAKPSEEQLREWYEEQYLTVDEVAEKCGVSRQTVYDYMDDYGIERRSSKESRAIRGTGTNQFEHGPHREKEWLEQKYWGEKMSQEEMAEEAGVTVATIVRQMQKNGVDSRENYVSRVLRDPGAGFVHADANGYETVKHSVDDHTYNYRIHRLLAIAKYGYDEVEDKVVHHKNGIPWDNRHDNIKLFDSQSEHARHHGEERGGLNGSMG